MIRSRWRRLLGLYALLVAGLFIFGLVQHVMDGVYRVLLPENASFLTYSALAVFVLPLGFVYFFFTGKQVGRVLGANVKVTLADEQEPLTYLMMGYSPLDPAKVKFEALKAELEALGGEAVASDSAGFGAALEKAGRAPVSPNPWQQNLRSTWHHRGKLRYILVLQPDTDQFDDFQEYLTLAFKNGDPKAAAPKILKITRQRSEAAFTTNDRQTGRLVPADYEDYFYVYEGMLRGLEQIAELHRKDNPSAGTGIRGIWRWLAGGRIADRVDRMTCVDATAGQKVFSVAAAALTINRKLKFSYVTTFRSDRKFGEVKFYDANLDFATDDSAD